MSISMRTRSSERHVELAVMELMQKHSCHWLQYLFVLIIFVSRIIIQMSDYVLLLLILKN